MKKLGISSIFAFSTSIEYVVVENSVNEIQI